MTLRIKGLFVTLDINDIQHNDTQKTSIEFYYVECRYAVCGDYLRVMLSVFMLNGVMLSVVAPCQ